MIKSPRIRSRVLSVICLGVFFCFSQAYSESVDIKQMTAKAQELQSQDRMQEAAKVYLTILNSYPNHEPTLINYAKLLYRMDKTSEACVIFSKVNLNHLDTATTYEYGLSHFWQKKYATSYAAFKRIPPGDPLADLSSYYGAISAFKLKRYTEADYMMNKAVVLPESLQESKKNYQKYIAEMKNFDEQKRLREETQLEKRRAIAEMNERKRLQEEANTKARLENAENKRVQQRNQAQMQAGQSQQGINKKQQQDILKKRVKIKSKTAPSEIFHTIEKEALIGYTYKNERYQFFDYGSSSSTNNKVNFSFKNAPVFFFGRNNPSILGFQLEVGGGYSISDGVEHRTFANETEKDKLRIYSSFFERQDIYYDKLQKGTIKTQTPASLRFKLDGDNPGTQTDATVTMPQAYNQTYEEKYDDDSFTGKFGLNPWIDFPLKNLFWISLGASVYMDLRDFEFDKSATSLGGYLVFGKRFIKDELARIYLKYKFYTILAGSSMEIYDNEFSLVYEQLFFKSLGIGVEARGDYYTYAYDDIPGPTFVMSTKADLYYLFPVGINIGTRLYYNYIYDYALASSSQELHILDLDTSGYSFGGEGYIKFQPTYFPYISLEVSGSYNIYAWDTGSDTTSKEKIEKSVPETSNNIKIAAGVNLFF